MTLETIRFLKRLIGEHTHIGALGQVIEELDHEESKAIVRAAGEEEVKANGNTR